MRQQRNIDELIRQAVFQRKGKDLTNRNTDRTCPMNPNTLARYVDNRLASHELKDFQRHLETCAFCRKTVQDAFCDLNLFGLSPMRIGKNPGLVMGTIIQALKNGLKVVQADPAITLQPVWRAATRGERKRGIGGLTGQITSGNHKLKIALQHSQTGKVQLSVGSLRHTNSPLILELCKGGKSYEKRIIKGKGQPETIDFGRIGKGHFELKTGNTKLFAFTVK
jgi:hypothetical protein